MLFFSLKTKQKEKLFLQLTTMEIVLGWPTIPEHGFCPGVWYKYSLSLN